MKKREEVSKIMTGNPITVNLSNNIKDVVKIFADQKIRHLPVVSGTDLIGMVSKNDIERISFVTGDQDAKANTQIYDSLTLQQVMTTKLITIEAKDEIRNAAKLLANGNYHALPVMQNGRLEGIVTTTDVINYLLEQY